MSLTGNQELDEKYDIFNFCNFPKGLGLNVKVETFFTQCSSGSTVVYIWEHDTVAKKIFKGGLCLISMHYTSHKNANIISNKIIPGFYLKIYYYKTDSKEECTILTSRKSRKCFDIL